MGGDRGPATVVAGIANSAVKNPDIGSSCTVPRPNWKGSWPGARGWPEVCEIRDAVGVVSMDDKPSQVMRSGKDTSMWSALDSVRNGEATVAVSCGNTGALMALSMIRLRKLKGVNRPAIAILWPSRNPQGFNVMLDVGADIRADAHDLLQYALMGASYARNGLALEMPRVGLLNVGTEEHKGRSELREAHELIADAAEDSQYEFVGFVEGGDIPGKRADVIVTDGFTGNVALKTGEGTASLIGDLLKEAFAYSSLSRLASLLALTSLRRLQEAHRPAPGQRRRVSRPQRHGGEIARLGGRDRRFGRGEAGFQARSDRLYRQTGSTGCIHHGS